MSKADEQMFGAALKEALESAKKEERCLCYLSLADTIRMQAETIKHLSDNLDAVQARGTALMVVAQAALRDLRIRNTTGGDPHGHAHLTLYGALVAAGFNP